MLMLPQCPTWMGLRRCTLVQTKLYPSGSPGPLQKFSARQSTSALPWCVCRQGHPHSAKMPPGHSLCQPQSVHRPSSVPST